MCVLQVINGSSHQKQWKMNWQQDEPKVIDEEMLKQAIEEQGPQGQAGDISKKEGIQYEDVLQLRLDYRSMNFTDHFTPKRVIFKI